MSNNEYVLNGKVNRHNNAQRKKGSGLRTQKAKDNFWGYVFILPNLIGFSVFTVFGIVFSLYMSFTNWNLVKGFEVAQFVGLNNIKSMFGDVYLGASLRNNLLLLLVIPITVALAAIFASIMNFGIYGRSLARSLFFLPYVTNVVAIATVWQALLHPTSGPINNFLTAIGIPKDNLPRWLSDMKWALPALMIILIWKDLGYNILMYSAGLQNISSDYYEAADIDGANAIQKFFYVTVPMLTPTTFLLTTLGIISSLQMWTIAQIITDGGPGTATYTLALYIYRSAFITYRTGYACALAWLLCIMILTITLIQWRGQKKWVNY
ncbi:MAG TPA: sugar ABC transporter permease [Clostridiaceae bacterium]|nr:sugar ABC transporter permease [Clostridiaceae bacterium]